MITKDMAVRLGTGELRSELHYTGKHDCARHIGPRGGVTENVTRVRVSGKCQTWKTRPDDFRLPVKYGMYESSAITHLDNQDWHLESECPLNATTGKVENKKTVIEKKTRLDMSGPFPIVYEEKIYGYKPEPEPKTAMARFAGIERGPFPVIEEIPTQTALDARTISAAQQKVNAVIDDPRFFGTWNCNNCGEVLGTERPDMLNEPLCDNCYRMLRSDNDN